MIGVLQVLMISRTAYHVNVTEMELNQMFVILRQEFVSARRMLKVQNVIFADPDHFIWTLLIPRDAPLVFVLG